MAGNNKIKGMRNSDDELFGRDHYLLLSFDTRHEAVKLLLRCECEYAAIGNYYMGGLLAWLCVIILGVGEVSSNGGLPSVNRCPEPFPV